MDPYDWYRRNYPSGPDHDRRCLTVLCSFSAIYNLPIITDEPRPMIPLRRECWSDARMQEVADSGEYPTVTRVDGGIEKCGTGLAVTIRYGSLSTFDGSELTRLVLAAHQHHCRVSVGTVPAEDVYDLDPHEAAQAAMGMRLMIHPRVPASEDPHMFARHPGLEDLARMIDQRRGIRPPTRTQTLLRRRAAA